MQAKKRKRTVSANAKKKELAKKTKKVALTHGADLVGIVKTSELPEHSENILRILPSARSVIVLAVRHSINALKTENNQMAQFDTIHTYGEADRAAHKTSRFLESEGFPSVAVPAFIPIDLQEPKKGMRGEICWRRAGVRAGLGSYGENGLLITSKYGAAVRLSGLVTAANLHPDLPLGIDLCKHCMRCIESCPAGALSGGGKIDKKLCGEVIFKYGFRFFQRLMEDMIEEPATKIKENVEGYALREMWQTFMTGNYYNCFRCQSMCPVKKP